MKKSISLSITAFAYLLTLTGSLHAVSSWSLVGLKNEKINTILHMSSFGDEALMVGTDKGVRWYQEGDWDTTTWRGLPVHDLKLLPSGEPVAVAGSGSDSDGVYLGKIAAIAKRKVGGDGMNTWWVFTLLKKHHLPTAVAFIPLDSNCEGKIYVGNTDGVATGLFCSRTLTDLTVLPGSEHQFGTECASMIVYSVDGNVYAGGKSGFTVSSIAPQNEISWLLRGTNEMTRFKSLKVTSLTEYTTQRDILIDGPANATGLRDPRLLAVATVDSGIRIFEGDYIYNELSSPVYNEPLIAIVPFSKVRTIQRFTLTMLAAATPSGVYLQCSPDLLNQWQKIGDLPHRPNCLAQFNGMVLWAGTDSGLYRYEIATPVDQSIASADFLSTHVSAVSTGSGNLRFLVHDDSKGSFTLRLFDLLGKCVRKSAIIDGNGVVHNLSCGMYRYRLTRDDRVLASGNVTCR